MIKWFIYLLCIVYYSYSFNCIPIYVFYQPLLEENYDKHPIFSTPGTSPLWTAAHIEVEPVQKPAMCNMSTPYSAIVEAKLYVGGGLTVTE